MKPVTAFLLSVALCLPISTTFAKGGGHGGGHSGGHGSSHASHSSGSTGHSAGHSSHPSHSSSHATSHTTSAAHGTVAVSHRTAQSVARDKHGRIARSAHAKNEFKKMHPCPSTGRSSGACPGYVIDHVQPLKRGGADRPTNMQWQTKEAAREKDKVE